MKTLTLTIAQFLLLRKVQERVGFESDKINDYLVENNEKENLPELILNEDETIDMVESLGVFQGEEEEMTMAEMWIEELYPEAIIEESEVEKTE